MMKGFVVTLVLVVACAHAKHIQFTDCGKGEVQFVDVTPCDSEPCTFKKGTTVTLTASIKANQDTKKASVDATVEVDDIPVDLPNLDHNLCDKIKCPTTKGQVYNAVFKIPVESYFPDLDKTKMTWSGTGDNGQFFCAYADISVTG